MEGQQEQLNIRRVAIAGITLLLSIFTLLQTGSFVTMIFDFLYLVFGISIYAILPLIIYVCINYIINDEYKFYKSKTFYGLLLFIISLFLLSSNSYLVEVGINQSYSYYYDRLDYSGIYNGGILAYGLAKPIILLFGSFGLKVIAIICLIFGAYIIANLFFEFDSDFKQIAKNKLTPKPMSVEKRNQIKQDLIDKHYERQAQVEFERAKPIDTDIQVKKDDAKSHYLNLAIQKPTPEVEFEVKERRPNTPKVKKETKPQIVSKPIVKKEEPVETVADTAPILTAKPKTENPNVKVMKIEEVSEKHATSTSGYEIPEISMLSDGMKDLEALKRLEAQATENAKILEMTLESFNLKAKISNVAIGPNITKYELQPEIGTKVSKFSSLSNDLAMALAATSIRIEAPIPGKAAVGIEIPNKEMLSVSLKEVLLSNNNDMDKKLQVALGKDITGESIFMEINKTPHMLVAGATGSGKSVSINSFILSILLKATPEEVKMIMIDPKKVELAPYNGIPHLLTPVVTEPKRAAVILKKMVVEMEQRYEMFSRTNTRNIEGFNQKLKKDNPGNWKELPYIVIIIDELADLMMVASNEVETSIARLAQMARAAGIHLVIATQRPSTDVITGLIKSNIPTRLSFSVSSSIDSRTILDQSGAEKLLGKGDMLYAANGSNNLERIQGTFVSDEEIIEVVEFINEQNYGSDSIKEQQAEFEKSISEVTENSDRDELFKEAVDVILTANSASTSLLQRRLKIGFNRASSIMEQMEDAGIVSANEGTKPRKILVSDYGDDNSEY